MGANDWDMNLAAMIDHTLLQPDAGPADIERLCQETETYGFASACIHPYWLAFARPRLPRSQLTTVIGFPLGLQAVQIYEAERALNEGADELDSVLNLGALRAGDIAWIEKDLRGIRALSPKTTLKLILETCRLSDEEVVLACRLAEAAGFDFVKTSTGFASGGASEHHVRLMRKSTSLKVKASGGIRTREQAIAMIGAGADRLGCSSSLSIIRP